MASGGNDLDKQGYDEKRFQNAVDENFFCLICMNVLKEPVQCRRNEHHYCTPCITRHLEQNSQSCPMCAEALTVETLKKPSRIVINYLSPLKINCNYAARGCPTVVELGVLETHVGNCNFSPVACSIDGCPMIINKQDKEHHETRECNFRMMKCDDCGVEVTQKNYKTHGCVVRKEIDEMKTNLRELKYELINQMQRTLEEKMKGMRNEMAEIVKIEMKKMTNQATFGPATEDIIVAGGRNGRTRLNSAEVFSWETRAWKQLPSMKQPRSAATSFLYENQVIVSGGYSGSSLFDSMEGMNVNEESQGWFNFPAKLPFKCSTHASVIYENRLIITGGLNEDERQLSDGIYEVLITPPYTWRLLCYMPQPRQGHGAVLFNDKILIVGGTINGHYTGSDESVLMYDITENRCRQIGQLPFPVSYMGSVCHEAKLVITGGCDKNDEALNKVVMYNINTGECEILPNMNVKRARCATVITGNMIVVMGGENETGDYLNSVECFNFDRGMWEELPPMIEHRKWATAAVKLV